MKIYRALTALVVVAFVAASVSELCIQAYRADSEEALASQICEHVTLRAQGGLSRDIQEQAAAILKLYAKNRGSTVVLSDGHLSLGVTPDNVEQFVVHRCEVDGQPDLRLNFYIERAHLKADSWTLAFAGWLAALVVLFLAARNLITFAQAKTHQAFTDQIAQMFDLPRAQRSSSIIDRALLSSGLFSSSALERLKERLTDLKAQIKQRDLENDSLQEQVKNKERIEKEAQAMERLTKQVRHDIASPLSALRVHLEGMEKTSREALDIENIVNGIEEILGDLETHEHISEGNSRPPKLDVAEVLIKEVIDSKNRILRMNGRVSIEFCYDKTFLSPVNVESGHFRRAMANIIQNAIDAFKGQAGHISVGCKRVAENIEVKIDDNGPGIQNETLAKLGAYGVTVGKSRGRGLGLYHARTSAERWGGTFSIASEVGIGTTVTITLPIAKDAPRYVASPLTVDKKRIVILDDEPQFAQLLAKKAASNSITAFTSVKELLSWYNLQDDPEDFVYLIDFHIARSGRTTGVHFVEALPPGFRTMIWSTDYTNEALVASAKRVGYPIFPKSLIA